MSESASTLKNSLLKMGAVVFSAYLFITLSFYFQSYPIPEFILKLFSIGIALLVFGLSWAVGHPIVGFLTRKIIADPKKLAQGYFGFILRTGLGLGIVSSLVFILGWILPGALSDKIIFLTLLLSVVLLIQTRDLAHLFMEQRPSINVNLVSWEGVGFLLAGLGVAVSFLSCFSPITYYDSLVYHLALPSIYSQTGKISAIPFNFYSYFPQQMEMIHLLIMSLCRNIPCDYAVNLLDWGISLMASCAISLWMNAVGMKKQALLAFVLWWTMPAVILLSMGGYVDVPLAFFVLLAVLCMLESYETNWNIGWLGLAGIFGSIASSTKYTGVGTCAILWVFLLAQMVFRRNLDLKKLFLFSSALLFPFGLWMLKNFIALKNPVFPFLYKFLGTPEGWTRDSAAGYFQVLTEYGAKSSLFIELAVAPWRIATSGLNFGGGMDVLGDFGWGIFIYGFFSSIFFLNSDRRNKILFGYGIIHFVVWVLSKPVLRFLVAGLPVFTVLAAFSIYESIRSKNMVHRVLGWGILVPWLVSNVFVTGLILSDLKSFSVPLGDKTYSQFLNSRLSYFSSYQYLNGSLDKNQKVIVLGDQRTFHLKVPFVSSNYFAPSAIAVISNQAKSVEALQAGLKQQGFTHILINQPELMRLGGMGRFGFSTQGQSVFEGFLRRKCVFLNEKNGVKIFSF